MKISSDQGQGRRAWGATIQDDVNSIGDAGSTRPGKMLVFVLKCHTWHSLRA